MTKEFFYTSYALLGIPITRLLWLDMVRYINSPDASHQIQEDWRIVSQIPPLKALVVMAIYTLWLPLFICTLPSWIFESIDWLIEKFSRERS